jgi:hypothetical protein
MILSQANHTVGIAWLLFFYIISWPKAQVVEAFAVYDCNHLNATWEVLNLASPKKCIKSDHGYRDKTIKKGQLYQVDKYIPVKASACKVLISKEVTRCGYSSLTYGSSWPMWQEPVIIPAEECMKAVRTGEIIIENQHHKVKVGIKETQRYYSKGHVFHDGSCTTDSFITNKKVFTKSYEETTVDITLMEVKGKYNYDTGEVVFTNGIRVRFSDGFVMDWDVGMMAWNSVEPGCGQTISEVYQGDMELHRRYPTNLDEAIVLVRDTNRSRFAGLQIKEMSKMCGHDVHQTQIQGLYLRLIMSSDMKMVNKYAFRSYFDAAKTDLQSQIAFLHLGSALKMHTTIESIRTAVCHVERKVLFNKLQAISSGNVYSLLDVFGHGHSVMVAGAVAYVTKGTLLQAEMREMENCTEEIPISLPQGKGLPDLEMFADPLTFVVLKFGTIVPCNQVMPVRWLIDGTWKCCYPKHQGCEYYPSQLNVTINKEVVINFGQGLGGGLYSKEMLQQFETYQTAYYSRRAVTAKVTNAAAGNPSRGQLGLPIDLNGMKDLSDGLSFHLVPMLWIFGESWHYVVGGLLLFGFIKTALLFFLRATIIYRQRGFGAWMFGAIMDVTFAVVRLPYSVIKQAVDVVAAGAHMAGMDMGRHLPDVPHPPAPPDDPPPPYAGVAIQVVPPALPPVVAAPNAPPLYEIAAAENVPIVPRVEDALGDPRPVEVVIMNAPAPGGPPLPPQVVVQPQGQPPVLLPVVHLAMQPGNPLL